MNSQNLPVRMVGAARMGEPGGRLMNGSSMVWWPRPAAR
jgi:hypothetical protein